MKIKPKFPLEWRMSEERMQQVVAYRDEVRRLEETKKATGKLVDGAQVITKALASRRASQAVPVMVEIPARRQPRIRV